MRKKILTAFPNAFPYYPPGGRFGRRGMLDNVYCIPIYVELLDDILGLYVAIENKSDVGTVSPMQDKTISDIRKAGGLAFVIRGKDYVKLKEIVDSIIEIEKRLNPSKFS